MTNIEIPISVLIYAVLGFLGLSGSMIGIYVSLTNAQTSGRTRIDELERKVLKIEGILDEHDDRINSMFMEIKDGIHRLEMMIEKLK